MYDVRLYDSVPACGTNWPPILQDMYTYLQVRTNTSPFFSCLTIRSQRPDVVRAIHATDASTQWEECRSKIHRNFAAKHSNASVTLLPRILERIPVLIFAGDQDLICNYVGLESMMQSMTWNGETGLGVCAIITTRARLLTVHSFRRYKPNRGRWIAKPQGHGSRRATSPTLRWVPSPARPAVANVFHIALQRLAHGRLRRPPRYARHDPPLHGR